MTDSAQNSKQILAQKGTAATPSISFLGGNATGMYSAGTNKLGFSTAGAFAAVIDASGNVGVGVVPSAWAATSYALQVGSGASMFSNNVAYSYFSTNAYFEGANWRYMGTGAAAQYVQAAGANIWYYAASGTAGNTFAWQEAMRIGSNGNVGIGTASTSSAKLQVTGSSTVSSQVNVAAVIGAGVTSDLLLGSVNGNTPFVASQGAYPLAFRTNANECMRIDASGNVGIGTTSPNTKLEVMSSALTDSIRWTDNTNSTAFLGTIAAASTIYTNTSLAFGTGSATFSEKMRIAADGAVGIGGTPSITYEKLRVEGTESRIRSRNTTSGAEMYMGTITANEGRVWASTNTPIAFGTNDTEKMRIDANGAVLVGTGASVVGEKLNVTSTGGWNTFLFIPNSGYGLGTTNASGTANYNALTFYNNGTSFSTCGSIIVGGSNTSFNTSSDYRMKENVAPMTTGLATVGALKPITYKWISTQEKGEGFLAHELAEVIPLAVSGEKDAVDKDGKIKPQGVDYSKVVVHLVAAIQELAAKVAALEGK